MIKEELQAQINRVIALKGKAMGADLVDEIIEKICDDFLRLDQKLESTKKKLEKAEKDLEAKTEELYKEKQEHGKSLQYVANIENSRSKNRPTDLQILEIQFEKLGLTSSYVRRGFTAGLLGGLWTQTQL